MPQRKPWTEEEESTIRNLYAEFSDADIANRIGRTRRGVRAKRERLGLARNVQRPFTEEEDEILRSVAAEYAGKHYHNDPILPDLARRLGRNVSSISERAKKIGIFFGKIKASGLHSGRKVAGWKRGRGGGRPIYEHTAVMEQHIGRAVRNGECVHHIDCDKDNNDIGNLYLCSSVSEHRKIHHQLNDLAAGLLRRGFIRFDSAKGLYEIC